MNIDPKSETPDFDQKVFNHLERRKEMSTLLNIKSDDGVKQWLESVDETMWEFCTRLRDAILHDPGTKGKMIIGKLLEPVFNDVKTLQSENQRLTEAARYNTKLVNAALQVKDEEIQRLTKINEELVRALSKISIGLSDKGPRVIASEAIEQYKKSKPLNHEQS